MIYQWRKGARFSLDAQEVGETVEKLAARNGGVCPPSAVVDEARSDDSPLHPVIFRLPKADAAEAWYQQEARKVINSLRVVQIEGEESDVPAFLHITLVESEGVREGYASSASVAQQPEWHDHAVAEALAALRGWRKRYKHIKELEEIFAAIEAVEVNA